MFQITVILVLRVISNNNTSFTDLLQTSVFHENRKKDLKKPNQSQDCKAWSHMQPANKNDQMPDSQKLSEKPDTSNKNKKLFVEEKEPSSLVIMPTLSKVICLQDLWESI